MNITRRGLPRDLLALGAHPADDEVLEGLVRLEQTAVTVYAVLAAIGLAPGARLFNELGRAHVDTLGTALKELGGSPPTPPKPEQIGGLLELRDRRDALEFTVGLETGIVGSYYAAVAQLEKTRLLKPAAEIMANHGQRLVVLRKALGRDPVPAAFEGL